MAPARRPTHLKVLDGTRESRINRGEPLPTDESAVVPPVQLSDEAQRVWDRLAPDMIDKGVLTSWDVDLFAVYCDSTATYFACCAGLNGDLVVTGSKNTPVKNPLWRIMGEAEHSMKTIGAKFGA